MSRLVPPAPPTSRAWSRLEPGGDPVSAQRPQMGRVQGGSVTPRPLPPAGSAQRGWRSSLSQIVSTQQLPAHASSASFHHPFYILPTTFPKCPFPSFPAPARSSLLLHPPTRTSHGPGRHPRPSSSPPCTSGAGGGAAGASCAASPLAAAELRSDARAFSFMPWWALLGATAYWRPLLLGASCRPAGIPRRPAALLGHWGLLLLTAERPGDSSAAARLRRWGR